MTDPGSVTRAGTVNFLGGAKRANLAPGPRAVYQAVLRAFAATGQPPEPAALEDTALPHGTTGSQALGTLAAADVLGLDDQGQIRMAYPFSTAPTRHVVAIAGGPRVYSMCAIDALGIPAMLGAGAVITSSDPHTGETITVTFTGAQAIWDPPSAVVFDGCTNNEGPAEQVSCGYLNFFVSAASAAEWARQHPKVNGTVLNQAHAEYVGTQTFGSLLND